MHMLLPSEPVRFTKMLEDTIFSLGEALRLTCFFSGSQPVSVSWTKDGKPIWASYKYNVIPTGSSCTLEVLNSDREEAAGLYSCQVSNAGGAALCDAHVICKTFMEGKPTSYPLKVLIDSRVHLTLQLVSVALIG